MVLKESNDDVPGFSLAVSKSVGLAPIVLGYVLLLFIAKSKAESTMACI